MIVDESDITEYRQRTIDTLLRLMGCTCLRSSKCEHVLALTDFGAAMAVSTAYSIAALGAETLAGGKPILLDWFVEIVEGMRIETHIKPGVTGRREGHL